MTRSMELEIKVGFFVAIGLGLVMFTILILGGGRSLFERSSLFHAKFAQVEGLVEGATVKLAGVKVGEVKEIKFLQDSNQVDVFFSVKTKYAAAVKEDSQVGIQTQGVLGDRYIIIYTGSLDGKMAANGSELKSEQPKDLKDYLSTADEVLDRAKNSLKNLEVILSNFNRDNRSDVFFKNITQFAENANQATQGLHAATAHLKSITAKIDNGEGTIGALVNDPSLYEDMKALLGGANRNKVLKYFIRKSVESAREKSGSK